MGQLVGRLRAELTRRGVHADVIRYWEDEIVRRVMRNVGPLDLARPNGARGDPVTGSRVAFINKGPATAGHAARMSASNLADLDTAQLRFIVGSG